MKFVMIIGPQAVGKMTVGQELEKITGLKANIDYTDRRPGDPARLVASANKILPERYLYNLTT